MMKGQNSQKGMTLLELMAVMTIGAMIMMGVVALSFTSSGELQLPEPSLPYLKR